MKNEVIARRSLLAAAVGAGSVFAGSVHAALPEAATTALASVGTGIADTEAAVWPYIGMAIVAGITIKLVKRFSAKI
ncbi:hypothetical protein HUF18_08115 [Thalassolituus sp. ST750PaO-4]|uniref:major coat protein n=1 Tax=Thalassolituus sp. ST750PaO-4 TaxID=2742965 RepID=UPI001CE2D071|nr:major coat protein [Thalassolituus sp. ST750PaO-4]MCA6059734.1 hypothetical protein [Thalassolituus sp. ST750PaO-4]